MKFCPYCGVKLKDDMMFCPRCGKRYEFDENQNEETPDSKQVIDSNTSLKTKKQRNNLFIIVPIVVVLIAVLAIVILKIKGDKNSSLPNDQSDNMDIVSEIADNTEKPALSSVEIAELSQSVLKLEVYDYFDDLMSTGSGFIAIDNTSLITNYHVIDYGYRIVAISENDVQYNVVGVKWYDKARDIAILKLEQETDITPLPVADSMSVKSGEPIYAIGSPKGLKNTVSNGIVSAIREENGLKDIQITAPISPGSSGGVLLNEYGEVLGITYASYSGGQNLNLAIPSEYIPDLIETNPISMKAFPNIAYTIKECSNSQIGNSIYNYSLIFSERDFARNGNDAYFVLEGEIYYLNLRDYYYYHTGWYGGQLSIYDDMVFFISEDGEAIYCFEIGNEDNCYIALEPMCYFSDFYITSYGIILDCTEWYDDYYESRDYINIYSFAGELLYSFDYSYSCILVNSDYLAYLGENDYDIIFLCLDDWSSIAFTFDGVVTDVLPNDFESIKYWINGDCYIFDFVSKDSRPISKEHINISKGFTFVGCSKDSLYYSDKDQQSLVKVSSKGVAVMNAGENAVESIQYVDNNSMLLFVNNTETIEYKAKSDNVIEQYLEQYGIKRTTELKIIKTDSSCSYLNEIIILKKK